MIISTNDVHGQIQQFPKLATFVDRVKAEYPNVILVDAGDRFTGNPYVDYAEERGLPIITLMNELGYAIGTLGNHEFDFGQKILRTRINDATFPIICANINSSQSELDSIAPYYIIEKDGIKLCFLGLIQTETDNIPSTNPEHLQKITFDNYLDKIEDYRKLKSSCHAFIGLTHLGVDSDSILATRMPELDMIIGGHSHTLLEKPKRVNNVLIGQTGIKLQYAGLTTLKFKGGKLTERIYKSCLIDTITQADSSMTEKVKFFVNPPPFQTNHRNGNSPVRITGKHCQPCHRCHVISLLIRHRFLQSRRNPHYATASGRHHAGTTFFNRTFRQSHRHS